MNAPSLGQVVHRVTAPGQPTVIEVDYEGQTYEVKLAVVVAAVLDAGMKNPIDGLPLFQVLTTTFVQTAKKP